MVFIRKSLVVGLVSASALLCTPCFGVHGFGNGGDPLALAFTEKATEIYFFLSAERQRGNPPPINIENFHYVVKFTHVEIVNYQLFDNFGHPVAARYNESDPQRSGYGKILLQREYWQEQLLQGAQETTYRFVLHEYLWAMQVDDTNYRVS
jgi:hypothetical protein